MRARPAPEHRDPRAVRAPRPARRGVSLPRTGEGGLEGADLLVARGDGGLESVDELVP